MIGYPLGEGEGEERAFHLAPLADELLGPAVEMRCVGKDYVLTALLSPEDLEWALARGNWFVTHGRQPAKRGQRGYAVRSEGKRLLWLHKEVLIRAGVPQPSPAHTIGDHINGVRLDCRRRNLRWATPKINANNIHGFAFKQMELELWAS